MGAHLVVDPALLYVSLVSYFIAVGLTLDLDFLHFMHQRQLRNQVVDNSSDEEDAPPHENEEKGDPNAQITML